MINRQGSINRKGMIRPQALCESRCSFEQLWVRRGRAHQFGEVGQRALCEVDRVGDAHQDKTRPSGSGEHEELRKHALIGWGWARDREGHSVTAVSAIE
jgi:hypothetical protein